MAEPTPLSRNDESDIAIRLRCHETEGVTASDRYHLREEAALWIEKLERENLQLQHDLGRATANHAADLNGGAVSEKGASEFEGYPGIAHDLETLRSALDGMCAEYRGLDLPYGSEAYRKAIEALNSTRRKL